MTFYVVYSYIKESSFLCIYSSDMSRLINFRVNIDIKYVDDRHKYNFRAKLKIVPKALLTLAKLHGIV